MTEAQRPARARDLGIVPGRFPPGPQNAITDVAGVRVGHTTVRQPPDLHTGVTAIVPDAVVGERPGTATAALAVGNGFGKLIGATQIDELGEIETPILLTATLSAFRAADALVSYVLNLPGRSEVRTLNPVVGETNDGFLSDIRRRPIGDREVWAALESASADAPAEGCVGAGTGTAALGYKGGIGTSSRIVDVAGNAATVGTLVQSNFSGDLTVCGRPAPAEDLLDSATAPGDVGGNSCMIIVATDAALDARQLGRVARRAIIGLDRVGADFAGGSGDYALAFSTAPPGSAVRDADLNPVFAAVIDVVEEALLNSLLMAETTTGFRGRVRQAVPHERLLARLRD